MKKYNKVIFVCNGNTCRSPMAATIFSSVKNDDKLLVASRGMVVLFDEPYNPKAVAVCAAHDMILIILLHRYQRMILATIRLFLLCLMRRRTRYMQNLTMQ